MAKRRSPKSKLKGCGHRTSRAGKHTTAAKSKSATWPKNSVPWFKEK